MGVRFPPEAHRKVTHSNNGVTLRCKRLSLLTMQWYVYIAKCKDESLYTGITTDLKRREWEHNNDNKIGAKSLRGKRPVQIIYHEKLDTASEAAKREKAIKNWKRTYKLQLIEKHNTG